MGATQSETSPGSREEAREGKRGDAAVYSAIIRHFDGEWIGDWMGGDVEFYCGSL
jgi:hypothetical protein